MSIFKRIDRESDWRVTYEGDCRREAVRVSPYGQDPLRVRIGRLSAQVMDISAGGLSLRMPGADIGETRRFSLALSAGQPEIKGLIEIIDLETNGVCHCKFIDLSEEMTEAIHQYALRIQKNRLREGEEIRE